jgi:hypothetical protein
MKDESTTYEVALDTILEGTKARQQGKTVEENPYWRYPALAKWWEDGWRTQDNVFEAKP